MAELVVERPGGRDRRAEALDQLGGQVLGRGLARRAGDARDRAAAGSESTTNRASAASAAGTSATSTEGTGTGRVASTAAAPGRDGGGGEVVPVGPLPRDRGEQAAGTRPAGSRSRPRR